VLTCGGYNPPKQKHTPKANNESEGGRQTQNEGFFAVPAKSPVTVDGKLDEWDLSGQIWSYADSSVRDSFSYGLIPH